MITAGCDVGSQTAKAVIWDGEKIIGQAITASRAKPEEAGIEALNRAMQAAEISKNQIQKIVATGYGKELLGFANSTESEIVCHAKGAFHKIPSARTIIDIGGQDAKAIKLDGSGQVKRYIYNDKCAAGTGRFLQIMAEALDVKLEEMGEIGKKSTEKIIISNQCVIFAETEVVSLINSGKSVPDILNALHTAVANRVAAMAKSLGGIEPDVVMTGGVAKNSGVFFALSEANKFPLLKFDGLDPQLSGALGAALIAAEK
ncbi:MAG: 2-hydroxyglutaryl-CoA dehydratase [Desulfobacterales bacterium]|nr:2-hydroxyglutaryl-CoA dehydratase [Desulfobacterales bacterium]MBF0397155.1 2-hydroxyglutaryl-CoA dehydratase [Desulfobacterales bacterium]